LARRILLIEDNREARAVIEELLREEGYEVDVAGDGQEALDRLAAAPPELVVTDLHMPRLGGAELLARLRNVVPETPILLMTAERIPEAERQRSGLWTEGHLSKPIEIDPLLTEVARLLAR
jgi:CheY-like chemotaxis protein